MMPLHDHTRLYRAESTVKGDLPEWIKEGQDASGHTTAKGRWFVTDPSMLDWYKEDIGPNAVIVHVDIPTADLEKYRVSNCSEQFSHRSVKSYSRDPENEFFLPRELADQARPKKSTYELALDEAANRRNPQRDDDNRGMVR